MKKSDTPVTAVIPKHVDNSWIMFIKDALLDISNFNIITLPHPIQGKSAKYCLDSVNNKIYEITTFDEPHRSWFIGEMVKSDGSIQMVTPINPLFLVLPRLKEQCSNRAVPLEDLLSEKGYDKILNFVSNLDTIGDLKGPPDLKAYKYNEEKTLSWLKNKVCRLSKLLRHKNIHVTSGATSATFVSSNINNGSIDEQFYLKYAFGMISQYLQDDILELLEKRFDFKPDLIESIGKKRKSEFEDNYSSKRNKCEPFHMDIKPNGSQLSAKNVNEVKKEKPLTTKEKARQKAASGTKTISSFFAKK